jgi:hypothetical protein
VSSRQTRTYLKRLEQAQRVRWQRRPGPASRPDLSTLPWRVDPRGGRNFQVRLELPS